MQIQWGEMRQVFGATVASTAALVAVFSLGVRGMTARPSEKKDDVSGGVISGSEVSR